MNFVLHFPVLMAFPMGLFLVSRLLVIPTVGAEKLLLFSSHPLAATSKSASESQSEWCPNSGSKSPSSAPIGSTFPECFASIDALLLNPTQLFFDLTLQVLDAFCRDLEESVACAADFSQQCFSTPHSLIYQYSIRSFSEFIAKQCDPKQRQVLLEISRLCRENKSLAHSKCSPSGLGVSLGERKPLDVNTTCTLWTEYIGCSLNRMKSVCGCRGSEWLQELFRAFGGPIFRVYCYDDDDSFACSPSAAAQWFNCGWINVSLPLLLLLLSSLLPWLVAHVFNSGLDDFPFQ